MLRGIFVDQIVSEKQTNVCISCICTSCISRCNRVRSMCRMEFPVMPMLFPFLLLWAMLSAHNALGEHAATPYAMLGSGLSIYCPDDQQYTSEFPPLTMHACIAREGLTIVFFFLGKWSNHSRQTRFGLCMGSYKSPCLLQLPE